MFLLIDNYDSFTFNLKQAFSMLGVEPAVLRNDNPKLPELAQSGELEAVCISPGPGHPSDAGLCREFLRNLPARVPVLGVCLGHQILGQYAGADIIIGKRIMHGKSSDVTHNGQGLFFGLPQPMSVARYHSLLVANAPSDRIRITAETAEHEIMALEYTDRPWFGVQFHPESVLTPDGLRLLGNFLSLARGESLGARNAANATRAASDRPAIPMSLILETLAAGTDLTDEMAETAFNRLMDGELSPAQAGAFLLGLRSKGETPLEMSHAVKAVLARAVPLPRMDGAVIDVVGTGGDKRFSFNCSTATALTLAGLGHKVLKHGNRSVSSNCGSADVLERLGTRLDLPPRDVPAQLARDNFVFLFAPHYHPSFKHIMPIRKEMGVRTLFNLLGPLVNPARPTHGLIGVPSPDLLPLMAGTFARLGGTRTAVVCGAGGYDELTPMGPADVVLVRDTEQETLRLDPREYGFEACAPEDLAVTGPKHAEEVLREILNGKGPKAMRDMLAFNLGLALFMLEGAKGDPIAPFMEKAVDAVARGAGRRFTHAA